jgi:uncharacterized protein (DUF927 family)
MNNNVFEEINQKADILKLAENMGFKPDRQNNIPCFIHNDHKPSLHLHTESNTWWCYVCGEGHTPIDFVMKHNGLEALDAAKEINKMLGLGIDFDKKFNKENEKPVKKGEYFYRRQDGSVTMRVDKMVTESINKKEFFPYALVDGKYKSGYKNYLKPEDCVLYNLPEVLNSDIIYFTEGEKDADTLKLLGFAGTTTPGGGRGLKSYYQKNSNLFEPIQDKEVRIISDNDETGSVYIEQVLEYVKDKVKNIKVFNLCKVMPKLKQKGDITDVFMAVGKDKTLEFLKELEETTEEWKEEKIEEFIETEIKLETAADVLNTNLFEKLYSYELDYSKMDDFLKLKNDILQVCKKEKIVREFSSAYKQYKERQENQYISDINSLVFNGLSIPVFNTNKYEMSPEGIIYEVIPNVGKILVCYHPIAIVERFRSIGDGLEKVKLAYYLDEEWNYIIVDKSVIASTQAIIKLSDIGIAVNSENAKYLVKYLAEIENLNRDKIKTNISVSRLGWVKDKLIPYNKEYAFDNEKEFPRVYERFEESGKLEDWVEFFRERRKYNDVSRIIMAGAVASILLKKINAAGFTIHVWGESEYGKSVACMVGQSIFGNPSQNENNGIGINFNFTNAGLEYRLNLYNNIPLFINEMQLQKEAKDYDKMLFMIETGRGKSRATKTGGIGGETSWNTVVITNGEKNIVKSNSDNGAYNRCLSCELTEHSYEDLSEVADFVKENYGTVIREILKHLEEYNLKSIYKQMKELTKEQGDSITDKQKIIEAIILTGDKILTDIIFKDKYYLTLDNFNQKTTRKEDIAIEERAYEVVKAWYASKKRCFLAKDVEKDIFNEKNIDIYGKEMDGGIDKHVAFIVKNLKDVLTDNGFDFEQITRAWARKGYTKCDKGKNQKNVKINGEVVKCVVLNMELFSKVEDNDEVIPVPFGVEYDQEILPF